MNIIIHFLKKIKLIGTVSYLKFTFLNTSQIIIAKENLKI